MLLAKPNRIPIKTDEGLTEVSSFTKKFYPHATFEENQNKIYHDENKRIEGGESALEGKERIEGASELVINTFVYANFEQFQSKLKELGVTV